MSDPSGPWTTWLDEHGPGLLLLARQWADGQLVLGAGPVLSYYEFKQPMSDRLTDEAWRAMLGSGKAPGQLEWTESYRAK